MAERTQYHGVYGIDGESDPIAIFKHADAAQQWRKQHYGDRGLVALSSVLVRENAGVAELLAGRAETPAEAPAANAADEIRKGEIRARLESEERDRRLEDEVRREMAAEREQGSDASSGEIVELREPAQTTGQGVALATADDGTGTALPPLGLTDPGREMTDHSPLMELSEAQADDLRVAGFADAASIRAASDAELLAVPGIGPATVQKLREATRE